MNTASPTLLYLLRQTVSRLRDKGIHSPEKEAEIIICHSFDISRTELYRDNPPADGGALTKLEELLIRRLSGEPLAYLTGSVEFYGLRIRTGKGVLIPRPETEILVEESLKLLGSLGVDFPDVLDLCTGTGCVAIAVARNYPDAHLTGTDISETAISYARDNAIESGVGNVQFLPGDLFEPVRGRKFHLLLSNPPYVRTGDFTDMQREVTNHEPLQALSGGEDGLDLYRRILHGVSPHLVDEGFLALEIGAGQSEAVLALALKNGLREVAVIKDLAGIERVLVLNKEGFLE